jgi:hypothetical protein
LRGFFGLRSVYLHELFRGAPRAGSDGDASAFDEAGYLESIMAGQHEDREYGAERVLVEPARWDCSSVVAALLSRKPTVNSSLKEIIKFVEEKYLKKSFVDPNQPLDPLKRWKMGQFETTAPKQAVQAKVAKEPARSKSIIETSDFSVFA